MCKDISHFDTSVLIFLRQGISDTPNAFPAVTSPLQYKILIKAYLGTIKAAFQSAVELVQIRFQ